MTQPLKWGIIGTGHIAHVFASQLREAKKGRFVAVGSRSQASADAFGRQYDLQRCHGTYDALLADPEVDAVYISTPHPMHAEWAIKAARAGKHILCEKPLTMNHAEAVAVVKAARDNDVFLMEAFMYRGHPQTRKLIQLIRDGAIGKVRLIQADFCFHAEYNPDSRVFDKSLGGGAILDVGCYCTSMSRLIAGTANGNHFADPITVKGVAHFCGTGADDYAAAVMEFPEDIIATLTASMQLAHDNTLHIYGSTGRISVPVPWAPARDGGTCTIIVQPNGEEVREISMSIEQPLYATEADLIAEHIEHRQAPPPAMTWDDTLGNMKTLDQWRESIGLRYEADQRA